jgi:hypothetical protein
MPHGSPLFPYNNIWYSFVDYCIFLSCIDINFKSLHMHRLPLEKRRYEEIYAMYEEAIIASSDEEEDF